jgi:hypothetical protein
MDAFLATIGLVAWIIALAEWRLIEGLSPVCRHLGLRLLTLKGASPPYTAQAIESRLWGMRARGLSDGAVLVRPRSWFEKGPSAHPSTMPTYIGVLRWDGTRWSLEIRGALGLFVFISAVGPMAGGDGLWRLVWIALLFLCLAVQRAEARRGFRDVAAQLESARVEQRVAADEASLSTRTAREPRR